MKNGNGTLPGRHPLTVALRNPLKAGPSADGVADTPDHSREFAEREGISEPMTRYLIALYSGDSPEAAREKAGVTEIEVAAESIRIPIIKEIQAAAAHQLGLDAMFQAYWIIQNEIRGKTKWEVKRGDEIAVQRLLQLAKMAAPGHFSRIAKNNDSMADANKAAGRKAVTEDTRKTKSSMLATWGEKKPE